MQTNAEEIKPTKSPDKVHRYDFIAFFVTVILFLQKTVIQR